MNSRCYVIAEAGVNHNGSLERAFKLIDAAAQAGVDAVKFQTFRSELVISVRAEKAEYQKAATGATESQLDMVRKLELGEDAHFQLMAYAQSKGLTFLSTPFDIPSVDFLIDRMKLARIKIPSGEITNGPLILRIAQKKVLVILSTGMATLGEVEAALGVLAFGYLAPPSERPSPAAFADAYRSDVGQVVLRERVTLLHCTTEYPAPPIDCNLRAIDSMRGAFGLPVGYSDHTDGIAISLAAAARGAVMIEKHFTLDRGLPGPDHLASLEPDQLAQMVREIRLIESALGDGVKWPRESERKNLPIARKSLVAATVIRQGEEFTADNIIPKRPDIGISPMQFWALIGQRAMHDYAPDEPIDQANRDGRA